MDNVTFYQTRISEFQAAAEKQREILRQNPNDSSAKFFADAYSIYSRDAEQDLALAQTERLKELFELRLFGEEVNSGSIRLDTLAKLVGPLSSAFRHAAHRLHFGKAAHHKVDKAITSMLDLRLGAIGHGSTKLFITGNVNPDLAGQSLLQQTLEQIFKLLTVQNEEFYDAVDAVGIKSARQLDDMLTALETHGMASEWHWDAPAKDYTWFGNTDEISRVKTLLSTISEPESYIEHLQGEVSAINDSGRLEIRTNEGKIKIRFALDQTPIMENIHLHESVNLKVETNRYFDSLSRTYVSKYFLLHKE